MKPILLTCRPFFRQISRDMMLAACLVGPVLMGCAFRFGLPAAERLLCAALGRTALLSPFYILFDLLLSMMAPILSCFSGVLVVLEERDVGLTCYYAVTPTGKSGYLAARLGLPAAAAVLYDLAVVAGFSLTALSFGQACGLCAGGVGIALVSGATVLAFAQNKMEGIALTKLCGLFLAGIPVAWFVTRPGRYLCGFLPSFWLTEACRTQNPVFFLPALACCAAMLVYLWGRCRRRLW